MSVKSLKIFVRVLVFGLLLSASTTVYADAIAITSVSLSNIQFTPAVGSATFTLTGASARAQAGNSFGENQDITSNTVPSAQAAANVTFAEASVVANTNNSISGSASVNVNGDCSCSAGSFSFGILTGTLLLTGGEGTANVTISGLLSGLTQMQTDEFGEYVEVEWALNVLVNGSSVFSTDFLNTRTGPNSMAGGPFSSQLSRAITLQYGAVNAIEIRLTPRALGINNEVPEPATVALLISGLGLMTGVLRKRRKPSGE